MEKEAITATLKTKGQKRILMDNNINVEYYQIDILNFQNFRHFVVRRQHLTVVPLLHWNLLTACSRSNGM